MSSHPRARKTIDPSTLGPPLPPLSILAILTSRGDGTFHWAIGLTGNPSDEGYSPRTFRKCHATQLNGPGWEFEDVEHDIAKLQLVKPLCVAVKIDSLESSTSASKARTLLAAVPMGEVIPALESTEATFTCRVWFKAAAMKLDESGVLRCDEVGSLERELRTLAERNDEVVIQGGPYIVHEYASG
ncbi:hypothetical protein PENSPDRAFT_418335 [Peniophora sp. CONT]|nr:hypothetical protein PENSPDRAFT_418335 [Peniophora sp. CONT]